MNKNTIIFDLDGTLVDSSSGILTSLAFAFREVGLQPSQALTPALIGPPLRETLLSLCPTPDNTPLDELIALFKQHYDTEGFLQTHPFPGIAEMLHGLSFGGMTMHIATNKRHLPTGMILDTLRWAEYFNIVLSPDSCTPSLPSKGRILAKLLNDTKTAPEHCLYVGDRYDDYQAAQENRIPFALATWGFDGPLSSYDNSVLMLGTPEQLLSDALT
jgi:phosphoglycolate phosphatase